jgi:cell division protein FtsQ
MLGFKRRHPQASKAQAAPSRRLRRYVLPGAAAATLALAAGVGYHAWHDADLLPVKTVRVSGRLHHVDAEQLRQAVAAAVRGNLLRADLDAVRDAVTGLPWVAGVSVHRVWPDTLVLQVAEQQAVAVWEGGGYVNAEGAVFDPGPRRGEAALPVFRGPAETAAAMSRAYFAMQEVLAKTGLRVTRLHLDDRRAWRVVLDNGIELAVGRRDWQPRLARFARVYPETLAALANDIGQVDLRYTNGFAVRWKGGRAQAEAIAPAARVA